MEETFMEEQSTLFACQKMNSKAYITFAFAIVLMYAEVFFEPLATKEALLG